MYLIIHLFSTRQQLCAIRTPVLRNLEALVKEVSMLMAYEVTRDLPLKDVEIETPLVR